MIPVRATGIPDEKRGSFSYETTRCPSGLQAYRMKIGVIFIRNYMMPVRATGIPDENRGSFSYERP